MEYIQLTLFGKTFPERSVQTKERISGEFSKKSQKPKFQYLKVRNGQKAEWSNYQTVQSLGELLTPSIGVFPNVAVGSTLSQILEVNAPQKYYLSPKACQGILRRAEKRGKELPPLLKAALEAQAEGKFLVTSGTDFESAGVQFVGTDVYNGQITGDTSVTLTANGGCSAGHSGPTVLQAEILDMTHANDVIRECSDTCPTLQARMGTGGNQTPLVFEPKAYGICSQSSNSMKSSNPYSGVYKADTSKTLDCNGGNPTCNQGGIVIVEPQSNVKCLTPWGYQNKRVFDENGSYLYMSSGERSGAAGANGKGVVEGESYTLNTVDRHAVCHSIGFCPNNSSTAAGLSEVDEKSPTFSTTKNVATCYPINTQIVTRYNKLGEGTGMGIGDDGDPAYTLQAAHSHGVIYAIDRTAFNQGENAKYNFQIENDGVNSTIVARGPSAVLDCRLAVWIVRRLTPRECERLQGFPDDWTMYDAIGNELKDTPRYKALGNSIAIPCALRVFQGIVGTEAAS